jgi:hypothetical protein
MELSTTYVHPHYFVNQDIRFAGEASFVFTKDCGEVVETGISVNFLGASMDDKRMTATVEGVFGDGCGTWSTVSTRPNRQSAFKHLSSFSYNISTSSSKVIKEYADHLAEVGRKKIKLAHLEEKLSANEKEMVKKLQEELEKERNLSVELNRQIKHLQDSLAHLDQKKHDAIKIHS